MEPTLLPGDWILVDPDVGRVRARDVVVARHPEHEGESIVKRLRAFDGDHVLLAPDAARGRGYHVDMRALTGAAWFRYWPLRRMGRVR
jgi:signal peptidase I